MQSQITHLPTDNIFKFYALSGLLLLVFSCGALLYEGAAANEVVFANVVEVETLKQEKAPTVTQQVRMAALQKRMDIAVANRKTYSIVLALFTSFASWLMYFGFRKWHREIQPTADATALVQLETARIEHEIAKCNLAKLRKELDETAGEGGLAPNTEEAAGG